MLNNLVEPYLQNIFKNTMAETENVFETQGSETFRAGSPLKTCYLEVWAVYFLGK